MRWSPTRRRLCDFARGRLRRPQCGHRSDDDHPVRRPRQTGGVPHGPLSARGSRRRRRSICVCPRSRTKQVLEPQRDHQTHAPEKMRTLDALDAGPLDRGNRESLSPKTPARAEDRAVAWTAAFARSATSASKPARRTRSISTCGPSRRPCGCARRCWRPGSICSTPGASRSTAIERYANVITSMQMDRLLAPTRPVQRSTAALGRQGAVQHRLRAVHRLARLHGGQSAVFAGVLHVHAQGGAAHHGGTAAGRGDDLLHRHPRLRKRLRRVLRAGPRAWA